MRVVIVGYGKMGKAIHSESIKFLVKVSKIIIHKLQLLYVVFSKNEIVIECTNFYSVINNIAILSKSKINVVCATTGWLNDLNKQFKYFSKHDMPKFIIFIVTWITNLKTIMTSLRFALLSTLGRVHQR